MNLFIDEVLEAQVNITEGYQGACQVMFFGGKEEESAVFSCLKEARRAAAGALNRGYHLAIINETTEAVTHESALHWLFPGVLATEQPLTESNQQQSIELTNDQINAMQIEADTMLSVFYSFERLQNYVRWGRGRADHPIVSKCHDILVNWFCLPVRHF